MMGWLTVALVRYKRLSGGAFLAGQEGLLLVYALRRHCAQRYRVKITHVSLGKLFQKARQRPTGGSPYDLLHADAKAESSGMNLDVSAATLNSAQLSSLSRPIIRDDALDYAPVPRALHRFWLFGQVAAGLFWSLTTRGSSVALLRPIGDSGRRK